MSCASVYVVENIAIKIRIWVLLHIYVSIMADTVLWSELQVSWNLLIIKVCEKQYLQSKRWKEVEEGV